MQRKILTDTQVRTLEPAAPGTRYSIGDSVVTGLEVRVTDRGTKTFTLRTRLRGEASQRWVIGAVGSISLKAARKTAQAWLEKIAEGTDPREFEKQKRADQAKQDANTFAAVAEEFIQRHLKGKRKAAVVEREIRAELMPAWGETPIAKIAQRDVVDLLETVKDRGISGAYARNIWTHTKSIFDRAISRGLLESSPTDRIKPKTILGEKRIRERVLSDDELRAIWQAAADNYPMGSLTQWIMLTGCRLSEGLGATWEEFDDKVWTIPAERFKMAAIHSIPLTDAMKDFLSRLPRWKAGDYLFSMDGKAPFQGTSKGKLRLDKASGVSDWVLHDVRRTCRTRLSALRVPEPVSELVIGHSKKGLERIYNQHRYIDEMREALTAWNTLLLEIVT
jgi:integrase